MLELMKDAPEPVLAIRANGEVTAKDYREILVPALQAALQARKKVRMLYHLGPEVSGFTAGAMWEDTKVGVRHLLRFEKVAVVSDIAWIVRAVKAFAVFIPCPVKVFSNDALDVAMTWISA